MRVPAVLVVGWNFIWEKPQEISISRKKPLQNGYIGVIIPV
jgi:hypothetical protein